MSEQSPELAQAQRAVLSPVYALVSCPGTPTSCVAQHVSEAEHALAGALRLAAVEGAHNEAELHACRYRAWTDGRQNAGLFSCRQATGYTQDFGPAGDQDFEMTEERWCRYCKRKAVTEAELAAARAACEVL